MRTLLVVGGFIVGMFVGAAGRGYLRPTVQDVVRMVVIHRQDAAIRALKDNCKFAPSVPAPVPNP